MLAHVGLVKAHVFCETTLARKAVIVLPRITKQHCESELIPRAQVFRFQEKIRNLGEAAARSDVGSFEDYVLALFENVANGTAGVVLHVRIIRPAVGLLHVIPCLTVFRSAEKWREHLLQSGDQMICLAITF